MIGSDAAQATALRRWHRPAMHSRSAIEQEISSFSPRHPTRRLRWRTSPLASWNCSPSSKVELATVEELSTWKALNFSRPDNLSRALVGGTIWLMQRGQDRNRRGI